MKFGFDAGARVVAAGAVVLSVALVLVGCGAGGAAGGEQALVFRLAEGQAEDHPTTKADQRFAQLVRERSGGKIDVRVFPSGQLGSETSSIEQVQTGVLEFARVNTSPMEQFTPEMGVFSLPFIFDSSEHMWSFLEGEGGQALLDELSESDLKGLAYYDSGARNFYTAGREVETPEDMRGLQVRVQLSDINVALIESLGAAATPMEFGEVYSALQTGVVGGAENNWPSYLSTSHYEVAPNFTLDEHARVPEVLLMNQDAWNRLSDEDKRIVQGAARDSVDYQREQWNRAVRQAQEEIAAQGVNIIPVEDKEPWREAVRPVIESHRDEYGEVLDQIEAARP